MIVVLHYTVGQTAPSLIWVYFSSNGACSCRPPMALPCFRPLVLLAPGAMSRRMSFDPSSLMADQRYVRLTCTMEPGLIARLQSCLDPEEDLPALKELARELLDALKEECGGGTSLIMVSRFAMGEPICEVRYDEPGNRDGLAAAVWLLLAGSSAESAEEPASPRQTTFIRHGPDESAMARNLYCWSGGSPPAPLPLLDTHVHFYDPSLPGGVPWPPDNNALLYRTVMPDHLTVTMLILY